MDKFETLRRIFTISASLVLVTAVSLIVTIPVTLQLHYPGSAPVQAAIASAVIVGIHLLIFFGFRKRIRQMKDQSHINKGSITAVTVGLGILGLMMLDGAFSLLEHSILVSVCSFVSVFCDLSAAIALVIALILLRAKKTS